MDAPTAPGAEPTRPAVPDAPPLWPGSPASHPAGPPAPPAGSSASPAGSSTPAPQGPAASGPPAAPTWPASTTPAPHPSGAPHAPGAPQAPGAPHASGAPMPTWPTSGVPSAPASGVPSAPASGVPGAPASAPPAGAPGPAWPTWNAPGTPAAPASGIPAAPASAPPGWQGVPPTGGPGTSPGPFPSGQGDPYQAGTHQAGTHQAGTHQAGTHQAGTHQAGNAQAGAPGQGLLPADGELPPQNLWQKMRADPEYAPEHLALEAVARLGPQAATWAQRTRAQYPGIHPDQLAQMAIKRFTTHARISGAAAGATGLPGGLIDIGVLAWTQARMVLHIAAAYGIDPAHPDRATDLLVLQKVHKVAQTARTALQVAKGHEKAGTLLGSSQHKPLRQVMAKLTWKLAQMAGVRAAKRLFAKIIPGASIILGTWANSAATKDLANRSVGLYRR